MAGKDYYDILGVKPRRLGRRDQEGVPQARAQAPSRRGRLRGEVQGDQRGVRGALRRREAQAVRPVRPVLRRGLRRRAPAPGAGRSAAAAPAAAVPAGELRGPRRPLRHRCSAAAASAASAAAARAQPQARRGRDLQYDVTLSLRRGARGHLDEGRRAARRDVRDVQGHGREAGHEPRRRARRATAPAPCRRARACSASRGRARAAAATGTIVEDPCTACRGKGTVTKVKPLTVNIPAGRHRRRQDPVQGQGRAGRGGRTARRPVRRHARQAAQVLQARRRGHPARPAGHDRRGGARRGGDRPDDRRAR